MTFLPIINGTKMVLRLTPIYRIVVELRYKNGLAYDEIAEVLDIPIGRVMSRLYYARQKLGKLMEEMV